MHQRKTIHQSQTSLQLILFTAIFFALPSFFFSGCGEKKEQAIVVKTGSAAVTKVLASSKVKRPMMGQDSFGLSVCSEVPKELVAQITGKQIEETADFSTSKSTGCKYYTNRSRMQHLLISVVYMNAENQKKGHQALRRTITTNSAIGIDHFIAVQKDGKTLNAIYLVMAPEKFVRIDRSAKSVATEEQMITLASKVSDIILYK